VTEQHVELLDDGAVHTADTHADVSKAGFPRWLLVVPLLLVGAVLVLTTDNAPAQDSAEPEPVATTTVDGAAEALAETPAAGSRIFGNEAERLGLRHGSFAYTTEIPLEEPRVVAIRSGANLMVIESTELLAHTIRLPIGSAGDSEQSSTLAIVLDKLIVSDGKLLRSLSVNGGVDVLLANDLVGYEVNGSRLLVAAQISDHRFTGAKQTELRVQGVHADFFGVPEDSILSDGSTVQWIGQRLFIERGGQVLVPTEDAPIPLGAGTVLAAGASHALIQRCSTISGSQEIECRHLMSRLDGSLELAVDDLDAVGKGVHVISPNGGQVFVVDDGSDEQFLLTLQGQAWERSLTIEGEAVTAAAFAPDDQTLGLARGNLVQFWKDGIVVGTWKIDGFDTITEITFAS
jgi:hypothetical protein